MAISASLVKELRDRTGAGMMECKKALVTTEGDIEKAIENMRSSGAIKAAKKQGRITSEGIVVTDIADDRKSGVIVELNCETDFVARGNDFAHFAQNVAKAILRENLVDLQQLQDKALTEDSSSTIEEVRQQLISKLGENINIRRAKLFSSDDNVASYIHGNRIGVLLEMRGGDEQLAKDLAMHIAAMNPTVVAPEDVAKEMIEKEKAVYIAQAQNSGKPAEIIDKMVVGRINKFLDEVSVLGQAFVRDPATKVGKVLQAADAKLKQFVRFEVGEGIEKKQENFAEEVMAQIQDN